MPDNRDRKSGPHGGGGGKPKYQGHGPGGGGNNRPPAPPMPQFSLSAGENATVDPELYNTTAEAIGRALIQAGGGNNPSGVSRHQLRRVFDEVKRLQRIADQRGVDGWPAVLPMVKLVRSKVHYVVARAGGGDRDYYRNLGTLIDRAISQIESREDFDVFVTLFEAAYGFYYAAGGAKK